MNQIKEFLTRRNIITLTILAVLAVGLLVGVRLVQQQTQLKSKAAGIMEPAPTGLFPCNRPTQFQVGNPVGRCGSVDANGCYLTGFARYTDNTLDINGDGKADPNDPGDQPQCNVACAEPKQCPATPVPACPASGTGTDTTCGQLTYDRCDTNPCKAQGATSTTPFTCSSSVNSACTGTYQCGSCAPSPATPSPSPNGAAVPVTIGGRVYDANDQKGIPNVTIDVFDGTLKQTRSDFTGGDGSYSISGFVRQGDNYTVRRPDVAPAGYIVPPSPAGRENMVAGQSDCGTSCDFSYTPLEEATCGPDSEIYVDNIAINQHNSIAVNTKHTLKITMNNPASGTKGGTPKAWDTKYYLSDVGSDSKLGLANSKLSVSALVLPGSKTTFSVDFTPTATGKLGIDWVMKNPKNGEFGGHCSPSIEVVSAAGGIVTCPEGTSVIVPDEPSITRFWTCLPAWKAGCRTAGIPPNNYTCAGPSETCLACTQTATLNNFDFSQCGYCRNNPQTQVQDSECKNSSATKEDNDSKCTVRRTIGTKKIKDICIDTSCVGATPFRECGYCFGTNCQIDPELCTDQDKPVCITTGSQKGFCVAQTAASPSPTTPPSSPSPSPAVCVPSQGDADKDGDVDLADFNIWFREVHSLTQSKKADFNCDGVVNTVDFSIWKNGYL